MMRRRLADDVRVVADGGEPKALVRDPVLNQCVPLPIIGRAALKGEGVAGLKLGPGQEAPPIEGFLFQYGQPAEVREAYEEAMRRG
jgi:5,5'-dehydrodivanillate O-demethylase